jgi:O-antigen/teichoic acid export membrane protein
MQKKATLFLLHSVSLSIPYVADLILKFLVIRIIATRLGSELLGTWGIFQTVILFPIFIQQSLSFSVFLQASRKGTQRSSLPAFALSGIVSVALGLLIVLLSPLLISLFRIPAGLQEMALYGFQLTAVVLVLASISQVFLSLLQASARFQAAGVMILSSSLLNSALDIYLLREGYGILTLLVVDVFTNFLFCIAGFLLCFAMIFRNSEVGSSKETTKELLNETKKQLLIRSAATVLWELDPLIISRFFGVSSMASYWIARRIPYILKNLIWTGTTPTVPSVTDESSAETNLQKIFWLQVFLILPVAVFLWLSSQDIIDVWVGAEYRHASTWMRILVVAITFDVLPATFFYFFLAKGKSSLTIHTPAYAAAVKLSLSIAACLTKSVELLMYATALGAIVFFIAMFRAVLKQTRMLISTLIQPFVASAFSCSVAGVGFHFMPPPETLIEIAGYALLFGAIAYGTNLLFLRQFYPEIYSSLLSNFSVFVRNKVSVPRGD